jgi:hypothetical protein
MTRVQTPRFCGAPRSAGVVAFAFGVFLPLRTSWLTVGTRYSCWWSVDFLTQKWLAGKQHRANRPQDGSRPPVEKAGFHE